MSVLEYNGGAIIALAGKDCVAIASDLRLGQQLTTLAVDFKKIYRIHDRLFVGLAGLGTDAQSLYRLFKFRHNLYQLKEERDIRPSTFGQSVSSTLYERRFAPYFASPVIAGLEPDGTPYLCALDTVGAMEECTNFVVAGTMPESLMGMCESVWRPGLEPEELFEVTAQCLLSGVNRDALSGWGAIVHVITTDRVITRTLKGRMD